MTSKEALEKISNIDLQEYPSEEEMYAFEECRVSPIPLGLCFTEEIEAIDKDLEVLDILADKLDNNTLYRVFPYEVAKQIELFLKNNELVREWLKGKEN